MRTRQWIAAGVLVGLATIGSTAVARELLVTGSGFVDLDLPGYTASSSFSYETTLPPGLLPVNLLPGARFTVDGVQSIGFGLAEIIKGGELGGFWGSGPFDWIMAGDGGKFLYIEANGVTCEFPQDLDKPECAGDHRWGWEWTSAVAAPEPAGLGLAALGLLVLCAVRRRTVLHAAAASPAPCT